MVLLPSLNALSSNSFHRENQIESDLLMDVEPSSYPTFNETLSINHQVISPQNGDGVKDYAEFSFKTSDNSKFNYTIEKDGELVDIKSAFPSIAGTSEKLYMVYTNARSYDVDTNKIIYLRTSENMGKTWSDPINTGIYYGSSSQAAFWNMELEYNASDGSLILLTNSYHRSWPYDNDCRLRIYRSTNEGLDWDTMSDGDINLYNLAHDDRRPLSCDMTISRNNTELYVVVAGGSDYNNISFFKSRDAGVSWKPVEIFWGVNDYYSPSVMMAPSGNLTVTWWNYDDEHFYLSNSTDFGKIWTSPIKLDEAKGLGPVNIPYNPIWPSGTFYHSYESGSLDLQYDENGSLTGFMIYNDTTIYELSSANGGIYWDTFKEYRDLGNRDVYTLDYNLMADGNQTLIYSGYLSGSYIPGSTFYLTPEILKSGEDINTQELQSASFKWYGKDNDGNYVDDGRYIAKVWLHNDTTGEVNPEPKYQTVEIDNAVQSLELNKNLNHFSPISSPGIQDDFEVSFTTGNEDVYYDMYVDSGYGYSTRSEARITNHENADLNGDCAFDADNTMHIIYVSYQDTLRAIYHRKSDDFGQTYTTSEPIVADQNYNDYPVVSIYGETIYVVYMRYRECINTPSQYVFDLFFLSSPDLGITWTDPKNITMGEFTPGGKTDYYCPDLITTENGTIFVGYNSHQGSNRIWAVMKSIDGGKTFSSPVSLGEQAKRDGQAYYYGKPIALTYDANHDYLYAAVVNRSFDYTTQNRYTVFVKRSDDHGNSWSYSTEAFYFSYAYSILGVTIDYLGDSNLTLTYYYEYNHPSYPNGYTYRTKSYDNGTSWTSPSHFITNWLQRDVNPSGDYYYSCIRSGKNRNNDLAFIYAYDSEEDNIDLYCKAYTRSVYHEHGLLFANTETGLEWDGTSRWGTTPDIYYNITVILTDHVGNSVEKTTGVILDNTEPTIYLDDSRIDDMVPSIAQTIGFYNTSDIDADVHLYYKYQVGDPWTILDTIYNGTHFVAEVPSTDIYNGVYMYGNATDLAGNTVTTTEGYYYEVEFSFQPENFPLGYDSGNSERKLDDNVQIRVIDLNWDLVENVYLNYSLNNQQWTLVDMAFVDESEYLYELTGSPQTTSLAYVIIIEDVKGTNHTYEVSGDNAITQSYIPLFPNIELSYPTNLYFAIAAALIGLIIATLTAISRNITSKRVRDEFYKEFKEIMDSSDKDELSMKLMHGKVLFIIALAITFASLAISILGFFGVVKGSTALLSAAVGLLASTFTLMEKVLIDASKGIYYNEKASKVAVILIVVIMAVVLVLFMLSGQLVEWFEYYIVQDTFTIGSVEIPNLWLSLSTPFLTIIVLIIITSYNDLNKAMEELDNQVKSGGNWKEIWSDKQEHLESLNSTLQTKVFVFIATISFSIISATEIGRYADIGILLLIPFIASLLVVLMINRYFMRKKEAEFTEMLQSSIIEMTKTCPKCEADNLFDNIYCVNCNYKFAGEIIAIDKTIACQYCKTKSPINSVYCRGCGVKLTKTDEDTKMGEIKKIKNKNRKKT